MGTVGPRNYISFTPSVSLTSSLPTLSDSVIIQEPFFCGDGLLTRTEECDTVGQLGVIMSGQVCEKQQNSCVLVTKSIINTACFDYQFGTQTGGHICDSKEITLADSTCKTMTATPPVSNSNGYAVTLSCQGNNTIAATPITIDCGNGIQLTGIGASLQGTCQYTGSFGGTAQCRVANDLNNPSCKQPISVTAGQCQSLTANDGNVIMVDNNGDNGYTADAKFSCSTIAGTTAHTMTIDCGDGQTHTQNDVSSMQATCHYSESTMSNLPITDRHVKCYVDNTTNPSCTQSIVLDQGTLGRCGDGIRQ